MFSEIKKYPEKFPGGWLPEPNDHLEIRVIRHERCAVNIFYFVFFLLVRGSLSLKCKYKKYPVIRPCTGNNLARHFDVDSSLSLYKPYSKIVVFNNHLLLMYLFDKKNA